MNMKYWLLFALLGSSFIDTYKIETPVEEGGSK